MDSRDHDQSVVESEELNEGYVEQKSVDSFFTETADVALRQAVDKIRLDVSGRHFDFKAGWENTGAYIQVRLLDISPAMIWKAAGAAISLFLAGWVGHGGWG